MMKSSSGAARDRPRNKFSLKTAWRSRPSSSRKRNHQARQDSGGLRTRRPRRVRQDQRTHESRRIIEADAEEIAPRDDDEHHPPPFVSFEGGTRAAARRTRGTQSAKQQTPLDQASLDSVEALPPLQQDSKSPIADVSSPTEQARNQRVVIGTPARKAMAEERRETKTCPPEPTNFEISKHQPDQRSRPAPSSGSHPIQRSIPLRIDDAKAEPEGTRTRLVARRRKMESSASREHIVGKRR
jgi:hypothetical protein